MPRKSAALAAQPERMDDGKLAELGRLYRTAKDNVRQAEAKADEYRDRILAELELRREPSVSLGDVLITRKRKRMRRVDIDALKKRLGVKGSKAVIEERVQLSALDALVQQGVLKTETVEVDGEAVTVVAGIETVEWSAPYVDVTLRKAE